MKRKWTKNEIWGLFFILPWLIHFLIFLVYPIYLSFKQSFLELNLLEPEKVKFVGLTNWFEVIKDGLFWKSIVNIFFNQSIFILLTFIISITLAFCLHKITKFKSFFRVVYFLPVVTSITVAMIVFSFLSGPVGPIQSILMKLHIIDEPIIWTFDKWLPMPVMAIFNSWKWFGIQMIILLAGMAGINQSIYEAAEVDGASEWIQFKDITLPNLKPQIVFIMTMNVINGLQMFTEVFMSFDIYGGPYNSALTPVMYLYAKGFKEMDIGYASAIGLMLAIIIFILTKIQQKIVKE